MSDTINEVCETRYCATRIDIKSENRLVAGVKSIFQQYQAWHRARNSRKNLLLAEDRALWDIGVKRRDIQTLSDRSNSQAALVELEIRRAQPAHSRKKRDK
ncbi:MAG: hypothetical protein COB93_07840 [Sneathiella sp.]|nr:MAG: hypothetical protein COB93_07840 [Sneathiella sp.]